MDLYVVDANGSDMGKCGAPAGTSERVLLDAAGLRPGRVYTVIVDFFRTVNETVTGKVSMPTTDTAPKAGTAFNMDCGGLPASL